MRHRQKSDSSDCCSEEEFLLRSGRKKVQKKNPEEVAQRWLEKFPLLEIVLPLMIAAFILLPLYFFWPFTHEMSNNAQEQDLFPSKRSDHYMGSPIYYNNELSYENHDGEMVLDFIEYIYELPIQNPVGIVFLAHGCSHGSYDWWPKSAVCKTCIGLPEERIIVQEILKTNMIPVAVTSLDRRSKCWRPFADLARVEKVLIILQEKYSAKDLPLYAFGASSGGSFILTLPKSKKLKFNAICAQISAGAEAMNGHPPTLFSHMPLDEHTGLQVNYDIQSFQKLGILSGSIKEERLALSEIFFSNRIEEISPEQSKDIFQALKKNGYLNHENILKKDPRKSSWRKIIKPIIENFDSLIADQSPISETLNVAWAGHELTSTHIHEILDFFESPSEFCKKTDYCKPAQ